MNQLKKGVFEKVMKRIGYLLTGIICIFLGLNIFGYLSDVLGNKVREYGFHCSNEDREVYQECVTDFSIGPTVWKVDKRNQWVIEDGNFGPQRFTDCAIVDRRNWSCNYDDKSGEFGFKNGVYYALSLSDSSEGFKKNEFWYMGKFSYWYLYLTVELWR